MAVVFKLNKQGFKTQVLQSAEMQNAINQATEGIRRRAGDGYGSSTTMGRNRALGMVWPDSFKAKLDNSEYNTLLKAIK